MTTTKRYEGSDHIFNNQNGDTCTIKAKAGQTLNIECSSIITDEIIISGGVIDEVETQKVFFEAVNPLTSTHQPSLQNSGLVSASSLNQGHRVAISDIADYNILATLSAGSTVNFVPKVGTFRNSATLPTFSDYQGIISGSIILSGYFYTNSIDISEDGTRLIWSNGYLGGSTIYVNNSYSGSWHQETYFNGYNAKITGVAGGGRIIVSDRDESVRIMFQNSNSSIITQEQILKTAPGGITDANILVDIDNTTCVYHFDDYMIIFTRSGTVWTFKDEVYVGTIINSLSIKGNIISCSTSTKLWIFIISNGIITHSMSFDDSVIDSCSNGNYVFCLTSSSIKTYYRSENTFIKCTYEQPVVNGNSICCNSLCVIVGVETGSLNSGYQNTYNVLSLTGDVEYNSIVLNENNLHLNSTYGSVAVNNVLYAPIVEADEINCNNNLTMYGYIKGKSDPSRFGYFKKNTSTTTTLARPVIFDAVVSEVSGLTYSYSGDVPNYNGSWTNTSGETMILHVSYSFRFTAVTNEIATFIAVDQPLDGSGVCTFTKVCLASQVIPVAYSGAYRTTTGSAVISLSPNSYFTAFYANGSLGDTLVYQTCTITMARLL